MLKSGEASVVVKQDDLDFEEYSPEALERLLEFSHQCVDIKHGGGDGQVRYEKSSASNHESNLKIYKSVHNRRSKN